MIRFLRNIRQKLLVKNQVTRCILYDIGEIFLVVIGILIALQFNNQNSLRKTKQETERLVSDLEKGLNTNQFLMERFTNRLYLQDSLMELVINNGISEDRNYEKYTHPNYWRQFFGFGPCGLSETKRH